MAVVIGKKCKNVDITDAYEYVFGYTVAQDISARDWQKTRNNGQWLIGIFLFYCYLYVEFLTSILQLILQQKVLIHFVLWDQFWYTKMKFLIHINFK